MRENPLNPAEIRTPASDGGPAGLPDGIQELLRKFVQLAREIEPYVQNQPDDSIYIDYRQGAWTSAMIEQFRREIYPYPAAVELLQFAAERAGMEVSYRDFLQRSTWSDTQVRSELGAISKVARKIFGKKIWPIRTRQGSDGVMRYLMPQGIGEWWIGGASPSRVSS